MKTLRQRYVSGRRGDDETNPRRNQTGQHVPLVIDPGGPSARSVYVTNEIGMCFVGRHAALLAGEKHNVACPSSLISASNFFELAVAAAISLFSFKSDAALATEVGVLIEAPMILVVVKIVNASNGWYERA